MRVRHDSCSRTDWCRAVRNGAAHKEGKWSTRSDVRFGCLTEALTRRGIQKGEAAVMRAPRPAVEPQPLRGAVPPPGTLRLLAARCLAAETRVIPVTKTGRNPLQAFASIPQRRFQERARERQGREPEERRRGAEGRGQQGGGRGEVGGEEGRAQLVASESSTCSSISGTFGRWTAGQ